MRKIKNIVVAVAITTMAFSITGCKMIEKTPEAIQKTVLAKVGDEKITMADVNSELQADIDYLIETYGEDYENNIDDTLKEQLKTARTQVLEQLVNDKVLITKGTALEYIPSEEELATAIEEERANFVEAYGGEDGLKEALEYYGMTEEKFNLFLENMVKTNKVKEAMTKDVTVTDEEVEQYYNDNIDKYTTKAGANAKHILFETEEEAQAAKSKIDSGEATFEDLYSQYEANKSSQTKPLSEDLGYVENEQDGFDTDFLAGFKTLKEGEVSAPVKSSFGYHIIKVEGIQTEEKVTSLDEVKDTIKSTLLSEKQQETYDSTLEEWKKELNVKLYEDRL
ncbi:peptidylprolyl isomerase [uncultured Clostridium sp.]|uniref:peptidylprolyl isomerase n=1 Tax=uncultured Clostridium sp. TaxID=59620 RepID=UPI0025E6A0BD|nr:peptidylprolyl isomerase [uncultured Clostridium sp.]MDU4884052.1 peptidylprolyl isomerase [Clostridium celatum]MDU7077882.1 peptidylprolyl isomerase [Clostridium celatum]